MEVDLHIEKLKQSFLEMEDKLWITIGNDVIEKPMKSSQVLGYPVHNYLPQDGITTRIKWAINCN